MEMKREMENDPETLLKQAGTGNQAAFKLLYDALAPKVLAFLLKMLNDRHLAEDVLQESMVKAWYSAADFDPSKAQASTWIIAIARHRALDHLRRNHRYERMVRDDEFQIIEVLFQGDDTDNGEPLSGRTTHRLHHCLEEIGPDSAACIQLAYYNGLSFGEIASYRLKPMSTVKSWVRRGMEKLRECLQR